MICAQSRWLADGLLDRLPAEPTPTAIAIYNELNATFWDDIRDFLAIHYAFNTRLDTPFWQACRAETDIAGAARVIEFYRENGPSLLGKTLLGPLNSFGMDGYLALLCGQRMPHASPHQPTAEEGKFWRTRNAELAAQAARAFGVKQALEVIRSPKWNWP